jgi:Protein of unknown function DUF262
MKGVEIVLTKPDLSIYTPIDFLNWRESGMLEIAPEFQRRNVWTTAARSYLIDTIIQGLPIPPIYLRVTQSSDRRRIVRQVVDGQQRISAVLDYLDDSYAISRVIQSDYSGKFFSELPDSVKDSITNYGFICEVMSGVSDAEILEIFARLNTYSIPLSSQELRNGNYFGYFKQSAYSLAYEHVEFWRRNRIFTERGIARMLEVELTSELLIAEIDGPQDKKNSITRFYAQYDQEFPERNRLEHEFRSIIDDISESLGEMLKGTPFNRVPIFYSLFCALYHRRFGMPKIDLETPKKPLSDRERRRIRQAVAELSDAILLSREDQQVPSHLVRFVNACLRQTDNIQPRLIRIQTIYSSAF